MKFAGWYGLVVGILMIAVWVFLLATGQVPELGTQPLALRYHLLVEFVTALALVVTGIGLLKRPQHWQRRYMMGAGMLIYSIVNTAGYLLQQGRQPVVYVFTFFLVCTFISIQPVLKAEKGI